jgi:hypothetical protein
MLVERQVSARPLVVFEIRLQDAAQACFMQDDDVVQALEVNRSYDYGVRSPICSPIERGFERGM